jgi:hypothetical protein
MTPEAINDLRKRVLAKQPVTNEELAAALRVLRGSRSSAQATSTASRSKKAPKTEQEALDEIDSLLGDI